MLGLCMFTLQYCYVYLSNRCEYLLHLRLYSVRALHINVMVVWVRGWVAGPEAGDIRRALVLPQHAAGLHEDAAQCHGLLTACPVVYAAYSSLQ